MSGLPTWVVDLVIALEEHSDEHPKFYAEYAPDYTMRRVVKCGCEPLFNIVPIEIRRTIAAIAEDRRQREVHS